MRTLLAAVLLASAALLPNAGCLGCSAYKGGGDTVYQRGGDALILCENGGFVATLSTATIEGFYHEQAAVDDGPVGYGIEGDNGAHAFDLYQNADGTATAPQLGEGSWQALTLNQTELDHANVQCEDLANRAWWTAQ